VKVKTVVAKQGNKFVIEYANRLKSLWMDLDHYHVIKTHRAVDSTIIKKFIKQDRVYDFLMGLNPEFDQVRIQILGKPQVPSLNEVVAIARSDKSGRNLMLDTPSIESLAMITESHRGGGLAKVEKKGEMWCTYCNKLLIVRFVGSYMENLLIVYERREAFLVGYLARVLRLILLKNLKKTKKNLQAIID
jgi:hypothetical protein